METTIIILSTLLVIAIFVIIRLIMTIAIWKQVHDMTIERTKLQEEAIDNQQATIDAYKKILSDGITGMVINNKTKQN